MHERRLEKIARSCGILPVGKNYKTTFEGCQTSKERSDKLVQLLREAGMKGSSMLTLGVAVYILTCTTFLFY